MLRARVPDFFSVSALRTGTNIHPPLRVTHRDKYSGQLYPNSFERIFKMSWARVARADVLFVCARYAWDKYSPPRYAPKTNIRGPLRIFVLMWICISTHLDLDTTVSKSCRSTPSCDVTEQQGRNEVRAATWDMAMTAERGHRPSAIGHP